MEDVELRASARNNIREATGKTTRQYVNIPLTSKIFASRDLKIGNIIVCEDPVLYFEDCVELLDPRKFEYVLRSWEGATRIRLSLWLGGFSNSTLAI